MIGDWFLYKYFIVLRVYGFIREPYRLPAFLTPRIFALEYMRQTLHVEEEHFGAFKMSSNIKFPLKVGSFIFKNKGALVIVEKLLENMDFQKEQKVNYDPYHIISLRKQANKNKSFDHRVVEGLKEVANLSHFVENPGSNESTSSGSITSQVPKSSNVLIKRSFSEIENMEIDEDSSRKKTKTSQDGKISSELVSNELKRVALILKKSVQMNQFSFESVNNP